LGNLELFRQLLLLKFPYLFFDLGIAFLLMRFFKEKKQQKAVFLLWIFSPLALYTSFMVGQFDVLPVFFLVLALYFAFKGKNNFSLLSLGIGGALKLFPLLLLPFFVFLLSKKTSGRVKLALFGLLPYLITVLPFIGSSAFRQVVLFSNQSQKMLFMGLPVSGAEVIYFFVVILVFLWFRANTDDDKNNLWKYCLVSLLLFFSVTHYHPQWFLWLTPFLILELVINNFTHKWFTILLFGCWFILLLFFESSLWAGLFRPVIFSSAVPMDLSKILPVGINPFEIKSLIRSIFAASSLFLAVQLFSSLKKNNV